MGLFSEEDRFITAEDYELWIRIAKNNLRIKFINENLGTFRLHSFSESSNFKKNANAIESIIYHYSNEPIDIKKCLMKLWLNTGKQHHLNGCYKEAFKYYIKSLSYSRTFILQIMYITALILPHSILKALYKKIISKV